MNDYYVGVDRDGSPYLAHVFWKKHKYIRIENGRYIYPKDENGKSQQVLKPYTTKETIKLYKNNQAYAKEQKKKTQRAIHKNVKESNKAYKQLKEMQDNYKPPKNKYNMTLIEKAREDKIKELNKKVEDNRRERARLIKQRDLADRETEISTRKYEESKIKLKEERKAKVNAFLDKFKKNPISKIGGR